MKKFIGFVAVAVAAIMGARGLHNSHPANFLPSPSEKQALRDGVGDNSDATFNKDVNQVFQRKIKMESHPQKWLVEIHPQEWLLDHRPPDMSMTLIVLDAKFFLPGGNGTPEQTLERVEAFIQKAKLPMPLAAYVDYELIQGVDLRPDKPSIKAGMYQAFDSLTKEGFKRHLMAEFGSENVQAYDAGSFTSGYRIKINPPSYRDQILLRISTWPSMPDYDTISVPLKDNPGRRGIWIAVDAPIGKVSHAFASPYFSEKVVRISK